MIIAQTANAAARRKYIEERGLAKVIFSHGTEEALCVQYHPRGIRGGVMMELDTVYPTAKRTDPMNEEFSPYPSLGPNSRRSSYIDGMRKSSSLTLVGALLRLAPGDEDVEGAAGQWEAIFGIPRGKEKGLLSFTNMWVRFLPGEYGKKEGLDEIVIAVDERERLDGILNRARTLEGVRIHEGVVEMLGVRWRFTPAVVEFGEERSKL